MPAVVASALTVAFVVYFFRRDAREHPNVTGAMWLPLLWLLIITTRFVSEWLAIFGLQFGSISPEEGSPLDAVVSGVLILMGLKVLNKRQVNLSEIVRNNRWLVFFFVYCFLAILWSDFPFVAFKRWTKILGHPIMALIILTEPDPEEALETLLKRCAYVVVPISILFIKYYPQWGRGFSNWTGEASNTGITTNKNILGCDCMILGFFFLWHWLKTRTTEKSKARRNELLITAAFLYMIWWLLYMAHSGTAIVSLAVAVIMMLFLGLRSINKKFIGTYILVGLITCTVAEQTFGLWEQLLDLLGKDPTLTDRALVWHDVLQIPINPVLGAGFESFWLGDRLKIMWEKWPWHPNQAHNGYLETYLNLGVVGLAILAGVIIATYWKARRELIWNFQFGRFRLGLLAAIVAYNWTEATFKALHPILFIFYIIALDYPKSTASPSVDLAQFDDDNELASANTTGSRM